MVKATDGEAIRALGTRGTILLDAIVLRSVIG